MKKLILLLLIISSCKKEATIKPSEPTGQIYFWNPYPISSIGNGIDILVDDTIRIHNYKAQGVTNGFWFKTKAGSHKWFYVVSTTQLNCCNYGLHGTSNVLENKNDTIKMIK